MFRVKGKHIYDERGNKFQIFGININGFELAGHGYCLGGMWANNTFAEIAANIRLAGWNSVRIPVHPKIFDNSVISDGILGVWQGSDNEKLKGLRSLDALDKFIDALEAEGIFYVIDNHYLEPGSNFDGDIPPLWYTNKYQEATWIKDCQRLAGRYGNGKRKGYIGIGLKNEPGKTCTWGDGNILTDWKAACEKAYYAIEQVDSTGLIFVGTFSTQAINVMHQNPPNIPSDRFVIEHHEYSTDIWIHIKGQDDPSFPRNMRPLFDEHFGNVARARAVYIGEMGGYYGTGRTGIKDKQHQDELIAYLKENDIINITPWSYGPNGGEGDMGTGGFTDAGYIKYRRDKLDALKPIKTQHAFFLDTIPTGPTKPVEPETPGEKPSVEISFQVGDIVRHRSKTGPQFLYLGNGKAEAFNSHDEFGRINVDDKTFYVHIAVEENEL